MRILHVMSWYVPEMGYQENALTKEQACLGHRVAVACGASIPESCRSIPGLSDLTRYHFGKANENGVVIYRLPGINVRSLSIIIGLRRVLTEFRPDVVHAHGAFSPVTILATLLSRSYGFKVFIDEHGLGLAGTYSRFVDRAYVALCRLIYRVLEDRVACFLPVTYSSRDVLQIRLGIPMSKVEMLPLGADTRRFERAEEQRRTTRREMGFSDEHVLIMTSGKFIKEKLVHVLIRAFGEVVRTVPDARLVLLGCADVSYRNRIKRLVDEMGLGDSVRHLDFVPNSELPRFYNSADIGVWPGLPSITALEAASVGMPIVVPSGESAYATLLNRSSAIGYERGNHESLARILESLSKNESYRRSVGDAAHSVVRQELSWEVIARRSIALYESRP